MMTGLIHTGLGSSSLIAHVLHSPPPPREQLCNRSCSNKHTHTMTGLGRPATCQCSRTGACRTLRICQWMRRCVLLRSVKIAAYQQQYADNQNISFLPAIVSTSTRMHGEFLCLLFLQAHRETEAEPHFTAAGMSSQTNNSEALRFKRAAFYNGLKSKVTLAAAKAAAMRVNLNVQGCVIVAPPMHAPSRTPRLLPLLLSHNLPTPRVH